MKKIGIAVLLFIEALQPAIDPDLGWHLRYGQYFFQTGHVLRDNILSFVWPQYHWVQASWGYDLVIYQLFQHYSFLGMAVVCSMLTLLTFLIATWPYKRLTTLQFGFLAILFMAIDVSMWAAGLRTPTLSTPFMALSLVISDKFLDPDGEKLHPSLVFVLPVLFLIWANLHGGFVLGLILLSLYWATNLILHLSDRTIFKTFGIALALSWLTPLLSPWGFRVYEETLKHSTNVNLNVIGEWAPLTLFLSESIVTGTMVLVTFIVLCWHKKTRAIPWLSVLAVTTYLAYSANRFAIVLGVIMVIILARNLPDIHLSFLKRSFVHVFLTIVLLAIVPLDMFVFHKYFQPPNPKILGYTWDDYCRATEYCSEKITEIMLANPPKGNGFHPYNYGGYLTWRVPRVKTFIDGRMVAWEENGKTPPAVEGDWVFMQNGPVAFIKFNHDYQFTWAIVPTQSGITDYLDDLVKNQQWKRLYQDKNYSYYVKSTNQ